MPENSAGWLRISSRERRAHRGSDGNETGMGEFRFVDEQCCAARTSFINSPTREYFDNFENRARMLTARKRREIVRNSLLILSFFPIASKISVTLLKSLEMSNVRPDFEDFRSPKFVDIGRIRRAHAAIENSVVNGAGEKSRVHRPESRICAWQSMGFHAVTAGVTISPSSFEGFVKKNHMQTGK